MGIADSFRRTQSVVFNRLEPHQPLRRVVRQRPEVAKDDWLRIP